MLQLRPEAAVHVKVPRATSVKKFKGGSVSLTLQTSIDFPAHGLEGFTENMES